MDAVKALFVGLVLAVLAAPVMNAQSPLAHSGMEANNRADIATAYRLLREAADTDDPEVLVNLGYLYARGQAFARIGKRHCITTSARPIRVTAKA